MSRSRKPVLDSDRELKESVQKSIRTTSTRTLKTTSNALRVRSWKLMRSAIQRRRRSKESYHFAPPIGTVRIGATTPINIRWWLSGGVGQAFPVRNSNQAKPKLLGYKNDKILALTDIFIILLRMQERWRLGGHNDYRSAGFYRPRSACDTVGLHHQHHRPVALHHNISHQAVDRMFKRPGTVNRYDYLGKMKQEEQKYNYPNYHSLNHMNRNERSRSPAALIHGINQGLQLKSKAAIDRQNIAPR